MNVPHTPQHNIQMTQPDAVHRRPAGTADPRDAALLGGAPATRTAAVINRIISEVNARFATSLDMSALVVGSYTHHRYLLVVVDRLVLDLGGTKLSVRCVRSPLGRRLRHTVDGRTVTGPGDLDQ